MATAGLPLWSTTAANNGSADPAVNFAEGQAPSSVNDSARALMASVAKWRDDLYGITAGLATGGTSTAYTVTTNATYATAAVMSGAMFTIVPHATNGASPTLAVDGLTARAINSSTGIAVGANALTAGTPYLIRYVHASTEFIVVGINTDILGTTANTALATDDTLLTYDLSATANRRMLVSDFFKIINVFSADASPDAAADYVMTYDASATAAKKVLLANLPGTLPRGYIDGCTLSNGTDATNDINIAAGVCRDSTNAVDIIVPAISGKQLDANWAAGGSAGMRNSAAGITDTTYHIWAARTAASSTADIYAHTSATAATVLTALQAETGGSSYVYARRIGSIVRASAAILGFTQYGDRFNWNTFKADKSAASISTTSALIVLTVPLGIQVDAIVVAGSRNNNTSLLLSSPSDTDQATSTAGVYSQMNTSSGAGANPHYSIRTDTSGQIRWVASGAITADVLTRGYIDARGKDS